LSPFLFAVFIDSVIEKIKSTGVRSLFFCMCVFLYADDILLIAPSVSALQILLPAMRNRPISKYIHKNTHINEKKSVFMRFGACFHADQC